MLALPHCKYTCENMSVCVYTGNFFSGGGRDNAIMKSTKSATPSACVAMHCCNLIGHVSRGTEPCETRGSSDGSVDSRFSQASRSRFSN